MKRLPLFMATVVLAAAFFNAPTAAGAGDRAEAQAATSGQTVTFAVEKMTCAACPITVRKAMEKVEGVRSVTVDFTSKTATVVFDPSVTTAEEIGAASTDAGYPATPAL